MRAETDGDERVAAKDRASGGGSMRRRKIVALRLDQQFQSDSFGSWCGILTARPIGQLIQTNRLVYIHRSSHGYNAEERLYVLVPHADTAVTDRTAYASW